MAGNIRAKVCYFYIGMYAGILWMLRYIKYLLKNAWISSYTQHGINMWSSNNDDNDDVDDDWHLNYTAQFIFLGLAFSTSFLLCNSFFTAIILSDTNHVIINNFQSWNLHFVSINRININKLILLLFLRDHTNRISKHFFLTLLFVKHYSLMF